jgi:hypothetical protein
MARKTLCKSVEEYIESIKFIRDKQVGNKKEGDEDTYSAIIFLRGTDPPPELGEEVGKLQETALEKVYGELFSEAKFVLTKIIDRAKSVGNSTANNCSIGGRKSKRRSNRRKSSRKSKSRKSKSKKSRRHRK